MDARQDRLANPLGMDEDCRQCPELCATRERIVHGYGPVDADVAVVGEMPGAGADASGVPFDGTPVLEALSRLGLWDDAAGEPANCYLTYLTRCRHPERGPADAEVGNCDPFLSADVRMVSPELLVPVGDRTLRALAADHTTRDPESLDADALNATTVRGRGFDLLPLVADAGADALDAFVEHAGAELGRDYRQAKGRRGRQEREKRDSDTPGED